MSDDLHLHGNQYSWLSSIFYVGFLIMAFPTSWLLTRLPIGKYLGTLLILWGGCLCFMSVCTSFKTAATVRFLLGMLEAGLLPSCIVITACWYRREEQPLRAALWFGPFSGVRDSWSFGDRNLPGSLQLTTRFWEEFSRTRSVALTRKSPCGRYVDAAL